MLRRSCAGFWLAPASTSCNQPDQALPHRADRLDAGAVAKGLQGTLVRDIGPHRPAGGDLLLGAELLKHGVRPRIPGVLLALSRLAQNPRACDSVHGYTSSSIPCSVSDGFQHC